MFNLTSLAGQPGGISILPQERVYVIEGSPSRLQNQKKLSRETSSKMLVDGGDDNTCSQQVKCKKSTRTSACCTAVRSKLDLSTLGVLFPDTMHQLAQGLPRVAIISFLSSRQRRANHQPKIQVFQK